MEKHSIFLLAIILSSCSFFGSFTSDEEFTLISWNIKDFSYSGSYQGAAEMASRYNADILLFQEMQTQDIEPFQSALIDKGISMAYFAQCEQPGGSDSLMVFSKFPLDHVRSVLDDYAYDPVEERRVFMGAQRPVLQFSMELKNRDYWFYLCHLDSGTGYYDQVRRRAQASDLRELILDTRQPDEDSILILGDMNTMGDGVNRDGGLIGPSDFTAHALDFDCRGDLSSLGTLGQLCLLGDSSSSNDFYPLNFLLYPQARTQLYNISTHQALLDHLIVSSKMMDSYKENSMVIDPSGGLFSDHLPLICSFYINY